MIFSKTPSKSDIQNVKQIKIGTYNFTIKKINPLLDFNVDTMPQIFTAYLIKKSPVPVQPTTIQQLQRAQEDIKLIVQAGLVKPELVPVGKGDQRGKEDGITVDDIFRDEDLAIKLYIEILAHSLNRFKGMRGLFFSIRIKHLLSTEWRKSMENYQAILFSMENKPA